jgi:dienelactone hydrolase
MRKPVGLALLGTLWLMTGAASWMQFQTVPEDGGQGMTVTGLYRVPEGLGPFPAVIMVPDCDGISPHEREWGVRLAEAGYAVHLLDSLFTRNQETGCGHADAFDQRDDVRGSIAKLLTLPEVDPERIYVMGWQEGADIALAMAGEAPDGMAGAVVFYPSCAARPALLRPTLFIAPDQYDGAALCDAYMRREHGAGQVKIQRIAPYGVGAGFDCENCIDGYLGGAGGYNQAAAGLVDGALLDEMARLIWEPAE